MKICTVGAKLFHEDAWADHEANIHFTQFCKQA